MYYTFPMGLFDFLKPPKKQDTPQTTVPPVTGPMPDVTLLQKNTFVQPKESSGEDKTKIDVFTGNPFRMSSAMQPQVQPQEQPASQNTQEQLSTPPLETTE